MSRFKIGSDRHRGGSTASHGMAYVLLALTMLFWGGNTVAGRLAVGEISPMLLTCMRWGLVAMILGVTSRKEVVASWPLMRPHFRNIALAAFAGFTAFNALFYVAAHHTTGVNMAIVQGSIPVLVLLGALALFGTRISVLQICGMFATLAGVAVVGIKGDVSSLAALDVNIGDLLVLLACILYAGYTLALRNRPAVPGLAFFAVLAIVAFITSLPLVAVEFAAGDLVWPGLTGWALMAYIAIFPSFLAQIFFIHGVELIGPGRAGLFVNLVPVFGSFLAVAILSEPFGLYHSLALALVLGGILLAEIGRPREAGATRTATS